MRMRTAIAALGTLAVVTLLGQTETQASSHREAPFITKNPKVDGTDFYMFQSYGDSRIKGDGTSDYTTIIANYQPLQDAYGGPNYFSLDPEALYEIHIENTGDAVEDITFQFQFKNSLKGGGKGFLLPVGGKNNSVPTVQLNIGVGEATKTNGGNTLTGTGVTNTFIDATNEGDTLNVQETYTVGVVRGPRRGSEPKLAVNTTGGGSGTVFKKPVDHIGALTNGPSYDAYAKAHISDFTFDGCPTPGRVFVGQRKEGFRVNLGLIFDLVNVAGAGGLSTILKPSTRDFFTNNAQFDNTANKNVTSIALEIPTACLKSAADKTVIGGWTTASVRQARVINPQATYDKPSKEGGAWAQVSRLGMPLTNEVVIGIGDKDRFNSSEPKDDAQFADYVTNPTLPQILQSIFGNSTLALFPKATLARTDLVSIFLTGITGVNNPGGGAVAEMLRLNTALPVRASGKQTGGAFAGNPFSGLGAAACFPNIDVTADHSGAGCNKPDIAGCFTPGTIPTDPNSTDPCDAAGFPNGRRPGDDVVDIELTVLLGYFIPKGTGDNQAPFGGTPLHDAVLTEEPQFDATFPYLKSPLSGDQ